MGAPSCLTSCAYFNEAYALQCLFFNMRTVTYYSCCLIVRPFLHWALFVLPSNESAHIHRPQINAISLFGQLALYLFHSSYKISSPLALFILLSNIFCFIVLLQPSIGA